MARLCRIVPVLLAFALPALGAAAQTPLPRIAHANGRFALEVDGSPYLVLGAQINNSSAWPATLPEVWPLIEQMHANTVSAPVYWETVEPVEGHFQFAEMDALVQGARAHGKRLILLWFGTWKNGQMRYTPRWVKADGARFPRMRDAHGEPIEVLSANAESNLQADAKAFAAMMRHLKEIDGAEHTVVMVQVENESGAIGSVRDFSPAAEQQFAGQVPAALVRALGKRPGTWREVFGGDADEAFQANAVSTYIEKIGKAGKAEYPLPLYCNVWVAYPVHELPERQIPQPGVGYPSGGAVQTMLSLWKANTPDIDIIGPDMYSSDAAFYQRTLDAYQRPDNPLWIPETGAGDPFGRYFFTALGEGAIGFTPFGMDQTGWTYGAGEQPVVHSQNFALVEPMDRVLAKLAFEGKLQTAVEETGRAEQSLRFGRWLATVDFGFPQPDGQAPPGTKDLHGRVLIGQLGPDTFLVTGFDTSVHFTLADGGRAHAQILTAEEGRYAANQWQPLRNLNGDQTDRGLVFKQKPAIVQIEMGTFGSEAAR